MAETLERKPAAPTKPQQPSPGPRVDDEDPVEEASQESFPASDPPAFSQPTRVGPADDRKDKGTQPKSETST